MDDRKERYMALLRKTREYMESLGWRDFTGYFKERVAERARRLRRRR